MQMQKTLEFHQLHSGIGNNVKANLTSFAFKTDKIQNLKLQEGQKLKMKQQPFDNHSSKNQNKSKQKNQTDSLSQKNGKKSAEQQNQLKANHSTINNYCLQNSKIKPNLKKHINSDKEVVKQSLTDDQKQINKVTKQQFQNEIERRYRLSGNNQTYKFPRSNNVKLTDRSSHPPSCSSLNDISTYDLNTQNLKHAEKNPTVSLIKQTQNLNNKYKQRNIEDGRKHKNNIVNAEQIDKTEQFKKSILANQQQPKQQENLKVSFFNKILQKSEIPKIILSKQIIYNDKELQGDKSFPSTLNQHETNQLEFNQSKTERVKIEALNQNTQTAENITMSDKSAYKALTLKIANKKMLQLRLEDGKNPQRNVNLTQNPIIKDTTTDFTGLVKKNCQVNTHQKNSSIKSKNSTQKSNSIRKSRQKVDLSFNSKLNTQIHSTIQQETNQKSFLTMQSEALNQTKISVCQGAPSQPISRPQSLKYESQSRSPRYRKQLYYMLQLEIRAKLKRQL